MTNINLEQLVSIDIAQGWGGEYQNLKLDLTVLICGVLNSLPKEQKVDFLHSILNEEILTETLIDRLIGNKEGFELFDTDQDSRIRLLETYALSKIEWGDFRVCVQEIKNRIESIKYEQNLFWKLYHHPVYSSIFLQWITYDKSLDIREKETIIDSKVDELLGMLSSIREKSDILFKKYLDEKHKNKGYDVV